MENKVCNKEYVIDCENLIKIYKTEEIEVVALQGLDLSIEKGEFTAIIGNSGSGKSTLLNMIGGLDKASAGKLIVDGKDLFKINEKQLVEYKRDSVGFVWQNNARNLIPYLTAKENIEMVLDLKFQGGKLEGDDKISRLKSKFLGTIIGGKNTERAKELLDLVELNHRENSKLYEMSGGEQQRVAIAIAMANNPKILLADEPTGQVDTKTTEKILGIFKNLNRELGQTILIVTHDRELAKKVDRVISISDGRTNSEFIRNSSYAEALSSIENTFDMEEQEEFAVIDRIGRVHLPKAYVDKLRLNNNRIKIKEINEEIVLYK